MLYVRVEFGFLGYLLYNYVNQMTEKLIANNAGSYFNSMCINHVHVMYAEVIRLLALVQLHTSL